MPLAVLPISRRPWASNWPRRVPRSANNLEASENSEEYTPKLFSEDQSYQSDDDIENDGKIDLDNQKNELIKCFECGSYFPRDFSVISSKAQICKNCKS